jgi:hypothetical protein
VHFDPEREDHPARKAHIPYRYDQQPTPESGVPDRQELQGLEIPSRGSPFPHQQEASQEQEDTVEGGGFKHGEAEDYPDMIPCIGVAFYNRRDLLQRLITSIDFPVGYFFTANNGQQSLHELQFPSHVKVVAEEVNEANVGCAGGWNQCLDFAFNQKGLDSVFIMGNDVEFAKGDLQRLEQTIIDFPDADLIFGNHSFSNFLVKRSGFEKIGWFNEDLFPAYWEDSWAWQVIRRTKAKVCHVAGMHSKHEGSATIKSDSALRARNDITFAKNRELYYQAWGQNEEYDHPFNDPTIPVNYWKLSEERMRQPHFRTEG